MVHMVPNRKVESITLVQQVRMGGWAGSCGMFSIFIIRSRLRSLLLSPAKRAFQNQIYICKSPNQLYEWITHQYTYSGLYVFNSPLQCRQLLIESGQAGSTRHVCGWHKCFNTDTMTVHSFITITFISVINYSLWNQYTTNTFTVTGGRMWVESILLLMLA